MKASRGKKIYELSFLRKQETRIENNGFRIKCGMTIAHITCDET